MTKRILAIAALVLVASAAQAATYSNSADDRVFPLGSPDTTSYGETFNLGSSEVLNSWSFFAAEGFAGGVHLVVANWDNNQLKPVGPELYRSASFSYGGGAAEFNFSNIELQLGAGSYIAYLSTAGEAAPLSGVSMRTSLSDGGLGGGFTFLNSNGIDPLIDGNAWLQPGTWSGSTQSMNYVAVFSAAVPEPTTYATMVAGLFAIGVATNLRRKRQNAKTL